MEEEEEGDGFQCDYLMNLNTVYIFFTKFFSLKHVLSREKKRKETDT
jgi:hypothetical protein